jgi:hypothetical protein
VFSTVPAPCCVYRKPELAPRSPRDGNRSPNGFCWLAAAIPAASALAIWLAVGGHLYLPETLDLLLGHLLYGLLVGAIALFSASISESSATAAIVTLAFTIGSWVLDFALAGQPGVLEWVSRLSLTQTLRGFEQGLLSAGLVLGIVTAICGFAALAAVWLHPGVPFRAQRWSRTPLTEGAWCDLPYQPTMRASPFHKLGHSQIQIRTEGSELGQSPPGIGTFGETRTEKELPKTGIVFPAAKMKEPWGRPRALDTRTPTTPMSSNPTIGPGALPNRKEAPSQIRRLAAAITIPVTNAAKQENTRRSCRILWIMAASPGPYADHRT